MNCCLRPSKSFQYTDDIRMDELEEIRQKKMAELVRKIEQKELGVRCMSEPVKLTDQDFDEFVKSNNVALVDCWAGWCMPCKMLGPVIEELAKDMDGKVAFGKLDVDENRVISARYAIMSIPTMLIFSKGQLVNQLSGVMPKENIAAVLSKYL